VKSDTKNTDKTPGGIAVSDTPKNKNKPEVPVKAAPKSLSYHAAKLVDRHSSSTKPAKELNHPESGIYMLARMLSGSQKAQ
jgi:hypothetical protein